ncbi:MAG: AAA family ATPase [Candidatus Omnitrophica bacterium]|nr:AAA family ATPase [Candidatus Omnitrophota bacterium]MDD5552248.1 AAA family ATPase [Candidatus Omnitrophota bacterium]
MTTEKLTHIELRKKCDLSAFDFKTTDELSVGPQMIGQDRALKAIDFGLNIKSEGFNLYVSGALGTGRNTSIIRAVEAIAAKENAPEDICYLYNFQKKDEPKALKLPAGKGCALKKDMEELSNDLEQRIIKAFMSEEYEEHKKSILSKFEEKKTVLQSETEEFARSKELAIQQTLTGFVVAPVHKGRVISEEDYGKMPKDRKKRVSKDEEEVYQRIEEAIRRINSMNREMKDEIKKLDEEIGLYAAEHLIHELKKKYGQYELIIKHLGDIQDDILKNIEAFKKDNEPAALPFLQERPQKQEILNKYRVNLLVDNCDTKKAPIIVEENPTYYNLNGYIEYRPQFGTLLTDFTMIKAGAVHKASGGYLILQAEQLLRDYISWDSLKKVIRYKKAKIEDAYVRYGFAPTTGLKPEPVSVDLKVIIVGNPLFYHLLYVYDEEFKKLFKIKADFDASSKKSDELIKKYVFFIAGKVKDENLLPFEKEAVADIIDYSSRIISHKEKLSARFSDIVDIMREADSWARKDGQIQVSAEDVKRALEEKVYRSNAIEKKIQELIEEGVLFIDTQGAEIGQLNGLAVIDLGDYMFGHPSRITARTYVGRGNIVNIEREAKLSGRIHSKGVLILSGYLGDKFAQDKPLALSASICFEQLYEEVEGDSASSAELYCLLSSLSEFPLRQDIAVTGSVDQRGRIQPIGGVNQKIEGFFDACKVKGLTGKQGVMIPQANVQHLMLREEVIQAVKENKFHIYPVKTINDGIEILTGKPAGVKQADGGYPEGSVNYRVNQRLNEYARIAVDFGKARTAANAAP